MKAIPKDIIFTSCLFHAEGFNESLGCSIVNIYRCSNFEPASGECLQQLTPRPEIDKRAAPTATVKRHYIVICGMISQNQQEILGFL